MSTRQRTRRAVVTLLCACGSVSADDYQAHCLYLGEAPSGQTNWSDAVRGLAHDESNWYITQGQLGHGEALWRIPVGYDLNTVSSGSPGVLRRTTFPELLLDEDVDWVFGDPCVYRFNGVDYLIVPYLVDSVGDQYYLLAVFDAQTLQAIDRVNLPDPSNISCTVDQQGVLYLSRSTGIGFVQKWTIDWPALAQTGELVLQFAEHVALADEGGNTILNLAVKGIELTPDDRYLFVVANDIHMFDLQTGRRIHKSTNAPNVFFPFYWDDSLVLPPEESPEGLTIWNLEGTGSPHFGQLHVLVRDWDILGDDDVFLKHYTAEIRVHLNAPAPGTGTPWDPFPTVTAAADSAWEGAEIRIDAGTYGETLLIDKRVRLRTSGGATRIGG